MLRYILVGFLVCLILVLVFGAGDILGALGVWP